MRRFIHRFKTQEEFNQTYNNSGYTEPWVSSIENGNTDFNNQNYVVLFPNDDSHSELGPKFSVSDLENNCPIIYFTGKTKTLYQELQEQGNTIILIRVSRNNYSNHDILQIWTDEIIKSMNVVHELDLVDGTCLTGPGLLRD